MKKLPIGIQTFSKIREDDYIYIDKTPIVKKLIDSGSYYFLSRPRRFGKSLFLDTLSELFKGSKEFFEELDIYDKWDWDVKYPVIKISFGSGNFSTAEGIQKRISDILKFNCTQYEIPYESNQTLAELVFSLQEKCNHKVVILIDEYDKPILDNITDKNTAKVARGVLRDFYGSIKELDPYLRFVFITGVSKFSRMNLFSGLNNLEDITVKSEYATITGYTQDDLEMCFGERLDGVDLELVRKWYNGYNYFGEPVYNPFDILLFLSNNCEFRNYWWETGNPAFLIEKLKETTPYIPKLESITVREEILSSFDVEHIDMTALLWQTGYLTFDKKINLTGRVMYKMKVPNLEVQSSLNELFLKYFTDIKNGEQDEQELYANEALLDGDLKKLRDSLHALFAAIPYSNYVKNIIADYEGYYSSIIFTFFAALGLEIVPEDITNKGRIDLTVKTPDSVYIFEFKVDSSEPAIHQIMERKYYEKYQTEYKSIYLVGINFSSDEKNITDFQWENP